MLSMVGGWGQLRGEQDGTVVTSSLLTRCLASWVGRGTASLLSSVWFYVFTKETAGGRRGVGVGWGSKL